MTARKSTGRKVPRKEPVTKVIRKSASATGLEKLGGPGGPVPPGPDECRFLEGPRGDPMH